MKYYLLFFTIIYTFSSLAQKSNNDPNLVCWSQKRRLTIDDFQIKIANSTNSFSSAQFSYDYKISTFLSLSRDYKRQITNCFIKNASWIDTTHNSEISVRYQQTLFDLSEIYIRQFRKFVYDNRKALVLGKIKIDDINAQIMNDLAKKKVEYGLDTSYGTIPDKQRNWEIKIFKEIEGLKEFSAE